MLISRLHTAGLEVSDVRAEETPQRYLLRRWHLCVLTFTLGAVAQYLNEQHEGLFGVCVSGPCELMVLADTEALVPIDATLPDDIDEHLLQYEDRVLKGIAAMPRDGRIAINAAGSFDDDLVVVDVPATTYRVVAQPRLRRDLRRWIGVRADGTYRVVLGQHAGEVLHWGVPVEGFDVGAVIVRAGLFLSGLLGLVGAPMVAGAAAVLLLGVATLAVLVLR